MELLTPDCQFDSGRGCEEEKSLRGEMDNHAALRTLRSGFESWRRQSGRMKSPWWNGQPRELAKLEVQVRVLAGA
jgi:hypothetical protein